MRIRNIGLIFLHFAHSFATTHNLLSQCKNPFLAEFKRGREPENGCDGQIMRISKEHRFESDTDIDVEWCADLDR